MFTSLEVAIPCPCCRCLASIWLGFDGRCGLRVLPRKLGATQRLHRVCRPENNLAEKLTLGTAVNALQTVAAIGATVISLGGRPGDGDDEDGPEGSYDENLEEARRIMDKYK